MFPTKHGYVHPFVGRPTKELAIKHSAGMLALSNPFQAFMNTEPPSEPMRDNDDYPQYNIHSYDERSQPVYGGEYIANPLTARDGVLYIGAQADLISRHQDWLYFG
jgi:hypothetical protein